MARHRDAAATRRISRGPVIVVVVVVVLALVVLGWFKVRDRTTEQSAQAAAQCVDGTTTLVVAVDPDAAPALTELAQRWTGTEPVIRDRCVAVQVRAVAQAQALAGLQGTWDTAILGPEPAVWVAQDSGTVARLPAEGTVAAAEDPASLMSSPVLLAVPAAAAAVAGAGVTWAQLPGLQSADDGWAQLGQPQWGALTVGLPAGSPSSTAAAQAVAAAVSGAAPVTDTTAQPDVAEALSALGAGPDPQPPSTSAALDALAATTDLAGTPYQLVPASEQQVFARGGELVGVVPGGGAPVLDFPYVALSAPWVDDTQSRAASEWRQYLAAPEQQQTLADAGFRAGDATLPDSGDAVAFAPVVDALAPADPTTADALTGALTAPAPAPIRPRSTVLLDVSGSMGRAAGPATRLAATTAALGARITALPDLEEVGLWTFSRGLDGQLPYRRLVPTAPLADGAQRAALLGALGGVVPESATSLYASTIAAYTAAVQSAAPDAPDSVLLITDGPDDDGTTGGQNLLDTVGALGGPGNGVRIDVITLGEADVAELSQVAAATGGAISVVGDPSTPALGTALEQLL